MRRICTNSTRKVLGSIWTLFPRYLRGRVQPQSWKLLFGEVSSPPSPQLLFDISRYVSYVDKLITMRLMIAQPPFPTCLYILFYYVDKISFYFLLVVFTNNSSKNNVTPLRHFLKHCMSVRTLYLSISCYHTAIISRFILSCVYISLYVLCHVDIF